MDHQELATWNGLPVPTWFLIAWFALACVNTYYKRIWQYVQWHGLPEGAKEPPGCLALLVVPQYVALFALGLFDWRVALTVYVLTFLAASFFSLVMELIGAILMAPFVLIYKSSRFAWASFQRRV